MSCKGIVHAPTPINSNTVLDEVSWTLSDYDSPAEMSLSSSIVKSGIPEFMTGTIVYEFVS